MSTGVNLYELLHGFWKENDYEPFPASATALFFFLLDRANSRHWDMPIRCPTTLISRALMVSEQTVLNSRIALYKRGIITFTKGQGNKVAPFYYIITDPKDWAVHLVDGLGDELTDCFGGCLGDNLGDSLDIYNKKDKKIKNQISSIYKVEKKNFLSLNELGKLFLSDKKWQADLISLLSKDTQLSTDTLQRQISYFFQLQKCSGTDHREEKECRTHFVNWMKKQVKSNNNGISKSIESNNRRGAAITATNPEDYEGSF